MAEVDDLGAARRRLQELVATRDPQPAPLTSEQQQIGQSLKDRCRSDFTTLLTILEARDPQVRESAISAYKQKAAQADAQMRAGVSAGLTVAAVAANAIPVAGQIASAVLTLAATIASTATMARAGAPEPPPPRQMLRALGSYRRFSPYLFGQRQRPPWYIPYYDDPDTVRSWTAKYGERREIDGAAKHEFMSYVDQKLAAYSAVFGLDLRLVFPVWDTANPPSDERIKQMGVAYLLTTDAFLWDDLYAGGVPGSEQLLSEPLYLLDDLPNAGSPEFEAIARAVRGG